jgi:hypothetical protein
VPELRHAFPSTGFVAGQELELLQALGGVSDHVPLLQVAIVSHTGTLPSPYSHTSPLGLHSPLGIVDGQWGPPASAPPLVVPAEPPLELDIPLDVPLDFPLDVVVPLELPLLPTPLAPAPLLPTPLLEPFPPPPLELAFPLLEPPPSTLAPVVNSEPPQAAKTPDTKTTPTSLFPMGRIHASLSRPVRAVSPPVTSHLRHQARFITVYLERRTARLIEAHFVATPWSRASWRPG